MKVLVFGTTYVDSNDRVNLTNHWVNVHEKLNPDCDLLLVDSASPMSWESNERVEIFRFPDNIGHLSRRGRDGWGRAFCRGLQASVDRGYDFVVHIEGDSLFRLPVMPIVQQMIKNRMKASSTIVKGMRKDHDNWVETGLMFFDVNYLRTSNFIQKYDWMNRQERPTPEIIIKQILDNDLTIMPWKALRGDKNQINTENVLSLDWVTHCHSDVWVYDVFAEDAMKNVSRDIMNSYFPEAECNMKINFGCGQNKLSGWENVDQEIDISRPLPYSDKTVEFILAEHVVEHIPYYMAVEFFKRCKRVLKPGGVLRVIVPSIEQIWKRGDDEYFIFTTKFQPFPNVRGAIFNILYRHGHQSAWTASLLETTLFFAGFDRVQQCKAGDSEHPELKGIDGHSKVIGEHANWVESCIYEATA